MSPPGLFRVGFGLLHCLPPFFVVCSGSPFGLFRVAFRWVCPDFALESSLWSGLGLRGVTWVLRGFLVVFGFVPLLLLPWSGFLDRPTLHQVLT